jgi:hypothetical protein
MAQPPPLAVRFKEATLEAIEAYRERAGVSRNRAVTDLVERGLLSTGSGLPSPEVQAAIKAQVTAIQGGKSGFTDREARDMFWRKTGAFNPRSKK